MTEPVRGRHVAEWLLTWRARDDAQASIPPALRNTKAYETEII